MVLRSFRSPACIVAATLLAGAVRAQVIPFESNGLKYKALTHDGILAIRWKLPSGTEIDTGFRASNRIGYEGWLEPYGEQEEVV